MGPSGHSAEKGVGRGKYGGTEIGDGARAAFRWAEAEQGGVDGVKGRHPRAAWRWPCLRARWWVGEGDLFGWEERFKHDGGSVASEALDANVSWGWTTRGTGQALWPRTPGQSPALQEKAGRVDAELRLGRVCLKGQWR